MVNLDKDAFSNGQIESKIWLCEELEKTQWSSREIHIYGGWYGMTAFLLLSRNRFPVEKIRSIDLDPSCEKIADMINENWVFQNWRFKSFTEDCNKFRSNADLIINTSTEHFTSKDWFNNIPIGTRVILQSNNMIHDDHFDVSSSLEDFQKKFPLSETLYAGVKDFIYPAWQFQRYMIIGVR